MRENPNLILTIGARNDDRKIPAVLAGVYSSLRGDIGTPECTLDVGEAGGLRASGRGFHDRVSLVIDVKSCAHIDRIALVCTLLGAIGLQSVKAQVGIRVGRGL